MAGKQIPTLLISSPLDAFGDRIRSRHIEEEAERLPMEDEWLEDLRQYMGRYPVNVKIRKGASRIFVRLTRTKVRTMDARIGELVLPLNQASWEIKPTPDAEISPERAAHLMEQLKSAALQGGFDTSQLTLDHVEKLEQKYAEEAAKAMTVKMQDVLVQSHFEDVARQVYHSGHLYGTGLMKGPLVEQRPVRRWERLEGGEFAITESLQLKPYVEATRIWDYFPQMSAGSLFDTDYDTQRHIFSKDTLYRLARRDDFQADPILSHIKENPDGDADWTRWEREVFSIGRNDPSTTVSNPKGKYEVLETFGMYDADDFRKVGIDIPEEFNNMPVEAQIWLFARTGKVIKARLNASDRRSRPWSFYVPEPEEGRPFGTSVPFNMRDTQQLFNAVVRAAADNMGMAVGPQVEIALRRLVNTKDIGDLRPYRQWFTDSQPGETQPAIQTVDFPIHTPVLMQFAANVKEWNDESSAIPSFQHGDRSPGVGRTVGGLSMLMGAANLMLKEGLRAWDMCLGDLLERLYDWHMQNDPDPGIKGDFNVAVSGAHSIMAKEFKAEKLLAFSAQTANPLDAPFIDRRLLLDEQATVLEIPKGIVKEPEQIAAEQQALAQQAQPPTEQPNGAPTGGVGTGGLSPRGVSTPTSGQSPDPGSSPAVTSPGGNES